MRTLKRYAAGAALALLSLRAGPALATPEIQHWTTSNGARVYFVSARELPMVDVQIVFDAGSARDGAGPGLARLSNALLDSGTATLSADAIADRLDAVGARLDSGVERDMAWLALRSLSDAQYLDPAADTVARLLREPAFLPESFARERGRMVAAVREGAQSPDKVAERRFYEALYGQHPYASPPEGTEASLEAISRDEVEAFYRRHYVAANAVVAVVGDLDRPQAERLAEALAGALPPGEPAPVLPPVPPVPKAEVIKVAFPSSQTHVYMGQMGIRRGDPDYYGLYLGNQVLGGGGLVSELASEVREKRGLSYSVYSYFLPLRQAGPFVMGLQTRNDQAAQAVEVVESTLRAFVENGPGAQELEAARQNIIGGFALRIDSNQKMVRYLGMIGFYGLPLDYLQTFPAEIAAISREQVTEAFRHRVHPNRLITVILGNDPS